MINSYRLCNYGKIYQFREFATPGEINQLQIILMLIKKLPKEYAQIIFLSYFKKGRYVPVKNPNPKKSLINRYKGKQLPMAEASKLLEITETEGYKRMSKAVKLLNDLFTELNDKFPEYETKDDFVLVGKNETLEEALEVFKKTYKNAEILNVQPITARSYKVRLNYQTN